MGIANGWNGWRDQRYKLPVISPGDVMYSMVTS